MLSTLPFRAPIGAIGAFVVTVVLAITIAEVRFNSAPPVQRFYIETYLGATARAHLPNAQKVSVYPVLVSGKPEAERPCAPGVQLLTRDFAGDLETAAAICSLSVSPVQMAAWLRHFVFGDQSAKDYFGGSLRALAAVFPFLLIAGLVYDLSRKKRARDGVQLRGPQLVSRWRFNRLVKGDGFRIRLTNRRNCWEWCGGDAARDMRIQRRHESNHIVTMADPGGGKTSLFMQHLDQIEERGETAIVYDPHQQFVGRYYNRERGDLILNPLDARCPSWSPSDEVERSDYALAEANALAMATSLFPGKPTDRNWFFTYCSQLIWKHLLVEHQPDAHEMAHLMQHSDPLIDLVVQGTELEQMMAENAQQQRAGVISHLTQVAYALRQIPKREDGRPHLVLREWSRKRQGWLFFTSSQDTRDGLRPIQSLWLDWLILCMLSQGEQPGLPRVFAALDECQTLQKLGQLVVLVTEGRKSLRVMYGIQGRSQIKALYGEEAEVLLSAPYTKFLMRTSEPEASKWLAETVGDVEIERTRESRPANIGDRAAHSYSTERVIQKLVLASEFAGLPDLSGYCRHGNLLLKINLPVMPQRELAERFIPREGTPLVKKPLPDLDAIRKARKAEEDKKRLEKERRDQAARAAAVVAANGGTQQMQPAPAVLFPQPRD